MIKKNTKEIIESFHKVHGYKYDYSKVDYNGSTVKVCIICPEHGEFWQMPYSHIRGCGCPECGKIKTSEKFKMPQDEFIQKSNGVHNNFYQYDKVVYKGMFTKVSIKCPLHGYFEQTPHNHLNGNGCPKCGRIKTDEAIRKLNHTFISESKNIHHNKYDYSKVNYINAHTKVCIICPEHGDFYQMPTHHISGKGCPLCGNEKSSILRRSNTNDFIIKSIEIHTDKYDYSKCDYSTARDRVCIICPKHGEFWQMPYHHLAGCGCPKCNSSRLEEEIRNILLDKNIDFEEQKRFEWLGKQTLDFYLPQYNIAIECQGIQHFEPIEHFGGEDALFETMQRDEKKLHLCEKNGLKLIYYLENKNSQYCHNVIFFTKKEELMHYLLNNSK